MKTKVCGTCSWHHPDGNGDWMCMCDQSDYCADWTQYDDACDCWEER